MPAKKDAGKSVVDHKLRSIEDNEQDSDDNEFDSQIFQSQKTGKKRQALDKSIMLTSIETVEMSTKQQETVTAGTVQPPQKVPEKPKTVLASDIDRELRSQQGLLPKSKISARTMLYLLLLLIAFYGITLIIILYSSLKFLQYREILPNFFQSHGLFVGVFAINLFATFMSITAAFRFYKIYNLEKDVISKSSDLKMILDELNSTAALMIICGFLLYIMCFTWRETIRNNILYAIKHAISDNDYAKDINLIQQQFKCCGVAVHDAPPQFVWLHYLKADVAFRDDLYRDMNSLPWSCCRSDYQTVFCEHFVYQRFLYHLNETLFKQLSYYSKRFQKDWDCKSFVECKQKQTMALQSVYSDDCAQAFYTAFKFGFFYLNGTMSITAGLLTLFVAAAITRWKSKSDVAANPQIS